MQLNPHKIGFGHHETFPLRYGWLPKLLDLSSNPRKLERCYA